MSLWSPGRPPAAPGSPLGGAGVARAVPRVHAAANAARLERAPRALDSVALRPAAAPGHRVGPPAVPGASLPTAAALGVAVVWLLERQQSSAARTAAVRGRQPGARRRLGDQWRATRVAAQAQGEGGWQGREQALADPLENLATAMELAERAEDYREAARLRDRIREAEAASPTAALMWRQRKQVQAALETALFGKEELLEARLGAIKSLRELASPPAPSCEAEDALHRVLRKVSGEEAGELRDAAEEALWSAWHKSGEEDVDAMLNKGMSLMEKERLEEAVEVFTQVIKVAPGFAEGWNKRATSLYVMKEYARSIDDCAKVLKLKPRHFGCLSGLGLCHKGRGDQEESMKWLKAALEVHPGMQSTRRLVLNSIVQEHLTPLIGDVVDALTKGTEVTAESGEGLTCTWDVHRVMPDGPGAASARVYFFRVDIRNEAAGPCPIQSLARFYVLQFLDGQVFPFTRLTEGPASFTLKPGEEYKFCWALIVSRELRGMAGGALLERLGQAQPDKDERYERAGLDPLLLPHFSPEVSMREVERLGRGYFYTGQLDLRQIAGL